MGIAALVSLILFFVFVARDELFLQALALQLSAGSQLGLHAVAALATIVAGCQVRRLWYSEASASINLDRLLLFNSGGSMQPSRVGCSCQPPLQRAPSRRAPSPTSRCPRHACTATPANCFSSGRKLQNNWNKRSGSNEAWEASCYFSTGV